MAEDIQQWEYRVQTIGGVFGTKNELIQATRMNGALKVGKP